MKPIRGWDHSEAALEAELGRRRILAGLALLSSLFSVDFNSASLFKIPL
jgi:hypothetical protein